MKYFANPSFWDCYQKLPREIQKLADENFKLLKRDSRHPSLHLKHVFVKQGKVNRYWSARVGIKYRTLAVEVAEGLIWFWIGTHVEYDKLIQS